MFRQSYLLVAVLCFGIFAGYSLWCIIPSEPANPHADAAADILELTGGRKDDADDTLALLQQRFEQAEQERLRLAERVAALEAVAGRPGVYPDSGTAAPAVNANEVTESTARPQIFRTSVETLARPVSRTNRQP